MKFIIFFLLIFILIVIYAIFYCNKIQYIEKHKPIIKKIRENLSKLKPLLDPIERKKIDDIKISPGIRSYTENKNDVFLCLEEPKTKKYYELNMLMYVTLHELAHIFCDEIGHTDKYKAIFKKILKMAEQVGIYDPNIELPKKYCNIVF